MLESILKIGAVSLVLAIVFASYARSRVDSASASASKSFPTSEYPWIEPEVGESEQAEDSDSDSVDVTTFTGLLSARRREQFQKNLTLISDNWDVTFTPMMLEAARFQRQPQRMRILSLLAKKTGQKFGNDVTQWWHWYWRNHEGAAPDYAQFKSKVYSRIDPSFAKYFDEADFSEIRLDEIFWGGVKRDGIPPLKDPKMLSAKEATYLADSDVVFGIKLNGDARCYPKRILAWHEMFKDTIGGESVCGVY